MPTIDVRSTSSLVRDALQVYADMQAGKTPTTMMTTQEQLASTIAGSLLPSLKQTYLDMISVQRLWTMEKNFQAALADAAANGALLAGFSAETWQRWGVLMLALSTFLTTPIDALGGDTPENALLRPYIPGTDKVTPPVMPVMPPPAPEQP